MRSVDEWIGRTDDTAIPATVQLRVFDRAGGRCASCGVKILPGDCQIDHIVALVNGGEHRETNLQPLHAWCHIAKTKGDVAEKARTFRARVRHVFGKRTRRVITAWRRFDGTIVRKPRERS